jgi:PAS domain S-box-containing protein
MAVRDRQRAKSQAPGRTRGREAETRGRRLVGLISRNMNASVSLVTIGAAALALQAGVPALHAFIFLALGALGLCGTWFAETERRRFGERADAEATHERARLETLSDRMWELQESEERFRGLIDALGDLVVHRDRIGRIVYANRVFSELMGLLPSELEGRTLADVGVEVGLVPDAAFADGECLSSTDVAIQTPTGLRWFSWIEHSVRDEVDDTVSHRAIARDITDRKRAETTANAARERAESASQAKSRFLASVSHEIRTPMNGIMGMATLLADTDLSPEQRTYVGAVSTSASALLALIEDLLDFSKIEAGRFELEPAALSPRELVENVVELLAARAHAKDIGIACVVAPDVPRTIRADPGRLRQVLLNLVGNAVKFTDVGGVTVTVGMRGEDEKRRLRFDVVDTGPGLDAAFRQRIFQEFQQADDGPTRRHGGAGLGLAISKRIVDAMGGAIEAEGEEGSGARFSVEMPVEVLEDNEADLARALAGRRALIVSARETEAKALSTTITAFGGACEVARHADEAASRLGAFQADTVLVDAELERAQPGLLARLKSATRKHFEAVTLIAPNDRGRLGEYRAAGYATFLARPVRGDTLLRVMLARLAEKKTQRAANSGPSRLARGGLSILLAEDNEINAMLARSALIKAGHRVKVVPNGKAAVDAVAEEAGRAPFDVVLMDLHMPVMDGMTAISQIRRREEQSGVRPVPIMVLSADGQDETCQSVLAHGADGFVTKPLDPHRLVEAVMRHARAA